MPVADRGRRRLRSFGTATLIAVVGILAFAALSPVGSSAGPEAGAAAAPVPAPRLTGCVGSVNPDLCNIEHVIFIVQENRSFDHYFGVYKSPSSDKVNGIPRTTSGAFAPRTCSWHPVLRKCLKPYHSKIDVQIGGPHGHRASVIDVNGGKMNGFIEGAASGPATRKCVLQPSAKSCQRFLGPAGQPDVMSFRVRKDIPNYWALADYGVLMDRFFMAVDSYTLPAHMFIFSGWAATCNSGPMSCKGTTNPSPDGNFAWTPLPYLLDQEG
ncbi:MAG: alkaline phosphatase family protein, partial [Actinobacteria bacterium]|nr:alkaline phosphatase family protein [Actinomycetota bacterium]